MNSTRSIAQVVLIAAVALLMMAPSASAAALYAACPTAASTTLQDLITMVNCSSQDKDFANFHYTPTGAETVLASNIGAQLVFQTSPSTSDVHGWGFLPSSQWTVGFTISYDISVQSGNPGLAIIQSKDQINTGQIPNGVVLTDTQTIGIPGSPLITRGISGQETIFSGLYSNQTVHTSSVLTFTGAGGLISFEQDFFENNTPGVPEPLTMFLVGGGLVGVGLLARKRRKV